MGKKVVSEKQLKANRRNALKSTGPRTPEGKERSSRNALKHGLLAREVVIRDGDGAENPAEFDALYERFVDELQPVGVLEEALVERIAVSHWRLRRALRFEVGAVRQLLDEADRPQWVLGLDEPAGAVELKLREARAQLDYDKRVESWAKEQNWETLSEREYWDALGRAWSGLARQVDFADEEYLGVEYRGKLLNHLRGLDASNDRLRKMLLEAQHEVVERQRERVEGLKGALMTARRYDRLRQERAALVYALPREDYVNKLVRYETMIDRELHRALSRLERLQRARSGENVPPPLEVGVSVDGSVESRRDEEEPRTGRVA
ncbi:MAG: hypothetical protein JSU86_00140 [Phycisphaerales bacterium]|nr:MAG: hypothetical protein JSU86_00140 [Phycisphaerales bacterium]